MSNQYHIPVLLNDSVKGLNIKPDGVYVDVTFGGGGHTKKILPELTTGKLIALDQDEDAIKNADKILSDNSLKNKFIFFRGNFKYLSNFIKYAGYDKVDGILADLGVSSHQFNNKERGFAFRLGGIPDMRMNTKAKHSSLDILNNYSEEKLSLLFKNYGELKSSRKLAAEIISFREKSRITNLEQLNQIINNAIKTNKEFKITAKVYQALRIETNKELDVLKKLLLQCPEIIKKGGRLVIISYHSLEDRIVKNFLKFNNFEGNRITDIYGKQHKEFKEISKKVIMPDENEIKQNNRARSAKLRIAEKI
ncbi:MAG: 16S rRNA (cytosine(1402)-N(4))-methyltransferase RsmH [Bacteroidales bacterium]|nr:16S rRNA (cytosine(1402)-N(4))-methyltransferase RsmH [Bacteroidales bacterium]